MSLKAKLEALSKESAAQKEAADLKQSNKELEPVRAKIQELEKTKLGLEMLKNSLDFQKTDQEEGIGMKEYKEETDSEKKQTQKDLEDLSKEYQETIKDLDIIKDFADDEEVIAYKQALEKEKGLKLSDAELKKRLASFGIDINGDNFSYKTASQEVGKRLEGLENELISEKLKTPEGKSEVIDELSEKFSKNTKKLQFDSITEIVDKDKASNFGEKQADLKFKFSLKDKLDDYTGDTTRIDFFGSKAIISNYTNLKLLPKDFQTQLDKYGQEIVQEAINQNYQEKVDNLFKNSDELEEKEKKMLAALELVDLKKRQQALETLSAFKNKKNEVLKELENKAKELKEQGIDFDSKYAPGYGGNYEEIFQFNWRIDANEIMSSLENNNKLFPKYDYDKIKKIGEKRISDLEKALKIIENIKTKEDVENFVYKKQSDIFVNKLAEDKFGLNIDEDAKFKLPEGVSYGDAKQLATEAPSYQDALAQVEDKISQLEKIKNTVKDKLAQVVDYEINLHNLKLQYGPNFYPDSLESMVKEIEDERNVANKALLLIVNLETQLPTNEDLNLKGNVVEVPARKEEAKKFEKEIKNKTKELEDKKLVLNKKKEAKPFFGKEKLRQTIASLEKEIANLETEITEKETKARENWDSANYSLNTKEIGFSNKINSLLKNYSASGKANEIFTELKKSLQEIADKEVPEQAQKLHDKFKELKTKLTAKK
jgi:hypothetical protein